MLLWKGRFKADTDERVRDFTQSLDLDWCLAEDDIRGSIAHARMLRQVGIISEEDLALIEGGLLEILEEVRSGEFVPDPCLEDVHMNVEARLTAKVGPSGAKLHSGRSRNDQVATAVRLYLRRRLRDLKLSLGGLLRSLLELSKRHEDVIVPGYTHLQQAQPISLGHYWMSHFWAFMRDGERLDFAMRSLRLCPLGAGALAGSTLPLDRFMTARELGFEGPTENSLDTVAQRDVLLDVHYFCLSCGLHWSRLCEDLIIYASREFGWMDLPDQFCTGSSMMPQKKNPDVLELSRGKASGVLGRFVDLACMVKGLPLTYNRDLQEDKRGLFESLNVTQSVLSVLSALLEGVQVDKDRGVKAFEDGLALATDVAEYLVVRNVPFREAHEKVGKLVRWCVDNRRPLQSLSLGEINRFIPEAREDLLPLLDVKVSVDRRRTYGGTSREEVRRQREEGERRLSVWLSDVETPPCCLS
ncbi:MAG: argininosuccinate lyase [Thermanaerothrix sp.]|nr:argininosuccinate lyase [Thermanaerothrix sp.]